MQIIKANIEIEPRLYINTKHRCLVILVYGRYPISFGYPVSVFKAFSDYSEPEAGAGAGAGNAKYLVTLYSSIFLRAIFFLIFSPLVFDGFLAGFLLSFCALGAQQ